MELLHTVDEVRQRVRQWRREEQTVALVPTMGNLHPGHLSLVEEARRQADKVVVSIFVNPTQFGPGEDFDSYPRTLNDDAAHLREAGVELLFAPAVEEIYPLGGNQTWVDVDQLGEHLCGAGRPGHFRGVATVVSKLFNIVQPDVAVFGEKDFQQLAILRRMTREMLMPIRIIAAPTDRDARRAIEAGEQDFRALEKRLSTSLNQHGFEVDYFTVANAVTLAPAGARDRDLVIAAAARLGKPRLIDNITVQRSAGTG